MRLIFKIFKWFFLGIVCLVLLVLVLFFVKNKLFLESSEDSFISYLKSHKTDLKQVIASEEISNALLAADEYDNQVFLLGEVHGFADVQNIDEFFIKHFNKKSGVRYYVGEMDSKRAEYLNNFLSKDYADTALLKTFVLDIRKRIPQQSSRELFHKWMDLYEYNKTLPDSLKLVIIGIDQDFDGQRSSIGRDSVMMLNFESYVKSHQLENEKFYGFFGYSHVLQAGLRNDNTSPFAAKLKKSSLPFSQRVQSIVCLPLESEMYLPPNPQYPSPPDERTSMFNVDGPFVLVKGIEDLKETTELNSITLFRLADNGSPYFNSQRLAGYKSTLFGENLVPEKESVKTPDLFQHVILLRGSAPLTRLK